ncbi:MAG: ABC transporter ATP-binding protein [Methanocorpusculum sp.]|nr:ABC transporter ATP-binding protein [Methanocorpusculum sp.]
MPPMGGGRHGGHHGHGGAKPKNAGRTILRILSYLSGAYKASLAVVLVCILIGSVTGVIGSLFLEILIDDYILPLVGSPHPVFDGMLKAILIMAGIYLAGVVSTFIYTRVMVVIGQGVLKKVRDEMFAKMQALPIRYFDTHAFGDTMSRYTNDTDTLRQMISQSVPQMFSSLITIVAVFAAMLYTSFYLTILVVVMIVFMFVAMKKIGGASALYFVKQQKSLGKVNGYIEEMITGQKVVQVFCREGAVRSEFDVQNDELCGHATKANTYANIFMPVIMNIGNIQFVLIAIFGGALAVFGVGGMTLGGIAAFLQLSKSFSMPVTQVSQQINAVVMALAGAERIFALMDEAPEEETGSVRLVNAKEQNGVLTEAAEAGETNMWAWRRENADGSVSLTKLTGDVRLEDVTFAYAEGKPVLHDISLYAKPGQKVALVGATGAGKTTITNLINRFYDVETGRILYDGIDVRDIRKSDLRYSLGLVLQDVNLFTGTIRENIRYGKLTATDEEVYAAARLANADGFISRLPDGYDTMLAGDGGSLSQGQRQLLSIARAAVANPPVMILDEATSSIDTRTEAIVQEGMDSLMRGRTVFVIAHRLSTVRNADAIMVMEGGRIIERGTHEDLIEKRGKYYQLYTGAFELE